MNPDSSTEGLGSSSPIRNFLINRHNKISKVRQAIERLKCAALSNEPVVVLVYTVTTWCHSGVVMVAEVMVVVAIIITVAVCRGRQTRS